MQGTGRRAPPGPQRRAAPRQHPRPDPLHPHAGRRRDHRDGPRHRLPPPRRWKRSASARPGTSSSPTRTAWTTWPGPPTTCPTSGPSRPWRASRSRSGPR
ncbi:MAG: hypothetical protein MZV70_71485 [Desulfobacterales bacterium]|nr:hypothetical protein [Desulfobacterales bacterium]